MGSRVLGPTFSNMPFARSLLDWFVSKTVQLGKPSSRNQVLNMRKTPITMIVGLPILSGQEAVTAVTFKN